MSRLISFAFMLALLPCGGFAQDLPKANPDHAVPAAGHDSAGHAGHDMQTMDHDAMQHAGHEMPSKQHTVMPNHDHQPTDMAHAGMNHDGMEHGDMGPQGLAEATAQRSPDYSDGIPPSTMAGSHATDAIKVGTLRFDRLEAFDGDHGHGQRWELAGWYGGDIDRVALRSEGERLGGRLDDAELEALWSHAIAPYWDSELGLRHDFGHAPARDWLAFGVAGLAPYFFELRATAYAGRAGRTALRFSAAYDLRFTQRLILEPELEANLYGKADPARGVRAGFNDAGFGLRLCYEIRREFAPYLGVTWQHQDGATDQQWAAGVRFWF